MWTIVFDVFPWGPCNYQWNPKVVQLISGGIHFRLVFISKDGHIIGNSKLLRPKVIQKLKQNTFEFLLSFFYSAVGEKKSQCLVIKLKSISIFLELQYALFLYVMVSNFQSHSVLTSVWGFIPAVAHHSNNFIFSGLILIIFFFCASNAIVKTEVLAINRPKTISVAQCTEKWGLCV